MRRPSAVLRLASGRAFITIRTMPGPIPSCDVQIRVRYAETDAMGLLHHAQYLVYFELGRTELLRLNGVRYRDMEERGIFYVVARLECRYKAPARYDDLLTLTTTTERLTPVRVEHGYRLTRDGLLLTEARTTLVTIGRDGRPRGLPDDLYERLSGEKRPGTPGTAARASEAARSDALADNSPPG